MVHRTTGEPRRSPVGERGQGPARRFQARLFALSAFVFTTDDAEKAKKAHDIAEQAAKEAADAERKAQDAKAAADAAAQKAGLPTDAAPADAPAPAEDDRRAAIEAAREAADEAAAAAAAAAAALEEQAKVKAEHDAFVAAEAARTKAAHDAEVARAAAANAPKPLPKYTVVSGDTLSGIGARYHVDWHKIAEHNHVKNPDLIYPGQVFEIPAH